MTKNQIILLTVICGICLVLGSWFFISPILKKQDNLDKQAELIAEIENGGGTVIIDDIIHTIVIDFYDEPIEETDNIEPPETENVAETAVPEVTETLIITGIGVLSIDKINLKLPVVDGVSEEQLKIAVGRVPETANIGEIGNAVIAGHRSYTYGDYFNRLGEMEIGDIISYTPKGGETMNLRLRKSHRETR